MSSTITAQLPVLTWQFSARQSSESQLTTFDKLESLLNEPPVALLSDFFELPDDFEISRRHDRGGYQVYDGTDGSKTFKREKAS